MLSVTAQGEFLGQRILLLQLLQVHIVGHQIILIHLHVVAQILPRGDAGQQPRACIVTDVQSCVQHLALIGIHRGGCRTVNTILLDVIQAVGETVLVGILIICREIHSQLGGGLQGKTHLTAGFRHLVIPFIQSAILEKATLTVVETCC